ncbi:calmodulin-binding transcription activator 2 isoform X1 [Triplophysa dalaica]|uniref:calmodulin-binding transcription activator 2 isoform X1 n=2 Tax=Triplophysa dalaica TaxID=1582913 RepID=UPI0024DF68BE|nr:calmodulin-binding transcription activator 2 isoform X1 [Triplophysa dalaica]XP_056589849.1 calmodulin-binding transcription activator 2 isoform X1 [Triplophysa dalaica]XP_056589850.1 calmodulin-binding transcription activator 2 isoform X1 [Triplophysa dalaica]
MTFIMNNKDGAKETESGAQMKVFLPNKLLECLPPTSSLPKERLRWNTNEEIASFLVSFDRHEEWLACTLKTRPQNGAIILYNRKKVKYRKDGYCWKKRKDGKTTREDHMKLKVQGIECLYGCYVHSSIVPTFHRRCYWLLQNPDIVLVHYLNVPSLEESVKSCGPVSCPLTDRRDSLRWSRDELLSQLKPMFHSMKWSCGGISAVEFSVEQMVQQILETQQTKPQPRTHTCLCASPGSNIPHRCTSTKHRIISPKLPTCPAPYPALTELQNLATESSGGEAGQEVVSGEAVVAVVPSERKVTSSKPEDSGRVDTEDIGVASPCSSSSSSSPPQTQRAATITLGNGNGYYGDQRGGLTTVALPRNAVIVMTTAATVGRGGGDSKSEPGPTRLSVTRAGSRLVLSHVPPKRDTPPPPTSPPSPVPANQGVATLSLTLLPCPVIGGLVLSDRIIPEAPGTLLRPTSPSPSLLPFDPDSFLNSPKQGQTYGGAAHPSHISIHSIYSSSTPSPVPSTSPQAPSLALSFSPTSPSSSLSSLSSETERKSVAGRPSSSPSSLSPLSLSLSPSRSTPELLPLCLESSLGLDPLTQPLSPALCTQGPMSSLSTEGKGPPAGLDTQSAPNHLMTIQFSPSQHMSDQLVCASQVHTTCPSLEVLPTNQSLPKGEEVQLLAGNSTCIQQQNMTPPASGPINGQMSPVQVKEERSPPTQVHFESEVTPMDTTYSSDSTHMDNQETGLTFDSTFPDLISELITEDTLNHAPNPPVYPVRYMVPPQPTPSTSFLPFPLLTHMSSGSLEDTHRLASITDFSPEWSYPEGGVKVLITGPWSETDARYTCVFDQSRVPASLIQPGVLRCYCPAHEAGLVGLHVWMDSRVVSSSVLFEYRARNASSLPSSQLDWLSLDDNQFRMSILERLEQMERRMTEMRHNNQQQHVYQYHQQQLLNQNPATRLTPENQSGVWFEHRIVAVCERMMSGGGWERDAERETLTHSVRHRGMTLLHLAAAQGYTQLIHTLIRWRSLNVNSLTLEQEVDPLNVDHFSCTPLMWACALGHQAAAVLLYRWSSAALGIPDSLGRLPLAVAHSRGHTRLARCLEELHTRDGLSPTYRPSSPLSSSPDTGLSSSSSVPSPSDPPSPSPSSAYSSGSVPDPMDSASSPSSPLSVPPPADSLFLMDYEMASPPAAPPPHSNTMSLADELLDYSENAENEDFLSADILQVDMTTLAEQIIEATPERIKQEEFNREAESPLRERRDNPAIHDTMPWLAPYLDTVDRSLCAAPPSPLSDLALQRLRVPSSAAWAEFLNASANGRMERDFALLTLTDTEQRELYEAARVIQNAFRRYKGRRLKEQQDMAAAVIQRCYRKYKQLTWIALKYALYKKMTQAAILIQSKFRSYYEQKKFQQSRRAAVLIQQYYRSYKEYERVKQGPRGPGTLNSRIKGSFLTKKQDQAARKIMRFLRRCRHRIKELKQSKELERRGLTT